jgi:leucyl aminopeptidase
MKVTVSGSARYDTSVIFLTEGSKIKINDFDYKKDEVTVRYKHGKTIIYCGLGRKKDCTNDILRSAAGKAIRKATELKRKKISLIDPAIKKTGAAYALLEGAVLGSYSFTKYKSEKPDVIHTVEYVTKAISKKEAQDTVSLCESVFFTRDLINDNASFIIPQRLAKEARKIASSCSAMTCNVLTEKEIERKGLGLLKAVGQGSPYPPRLIFLRYKGNAKSKESTAIIGKGITFDSGGLNLKPSNHIETMRCDMSGAASVLGTMKAIAALKPKVNVTGVVTSAYNAIDGKSYFPGDTYKSYSGKNVEILNTDAEGRLILADAISYCIKNYKPAKIIDLATLTGAIVTALGTMYAGLFSNNDPLSKKLLEAGEKSGEKLWRMPLIKEHTESMKSEIADLRNISKLPKGQASSSTAAAFLQSFVEETPWVHLDIAGVAFNDKDSNGEIPKYGTGFGVRLLMAYFM